MQSVRIVCSRDPVVVLIGLTSACFGRYWERFDRSGLSHGTIFDKAPDDRRAPGRVPWSRILHSYIKARFRHHQLQCSGFRAANPTGAKLSVYLNVFDAIARWVQNDGLEE